MHSAECCCSYMKTMHDDILEVLLTEEEIAKRRDEVAAEIRRDFADKHPLFIGVLRGSFIFMADLVRKVDIPSTLDFMATSSYGKSTTSSGTITVTKDISADIEGRHVIIVEDILDSGMTLKYITDLLKARGTRSIKIATLLDKPARRVADIKADYFCFDIPDEFVVGYGLDYDEKYRNLPYIGVLKPEIYS